MVHTGTAMDTHPTTQGHAAGTGRGASFVAMGVVGLVVLLDVVGSWSHRAEGKQAAVFAALIALETLSAAVVGLLIVRVQPRNVVGWLLLAHGLSVALVLDSDGISTEGSAGRLLAQLGLGMWPLLYVWLAVIAYVFPDGHFLNARWRRFAVGCLVGYVVFMVAAVLDVEGFGSEYPGVEPAISAPSGSMRTVVGVAGCSVSRRSRPAWSEPSPACTSGCVGRAGMTGCGCCGWPGGR